MKYFFPSYMIAIALGASLVSASSLEQRDGPNFYKGKAQGPQYQDVRIAQKNLFGNPLGAVLTSLLPPGSEWFRKNVIKSVDNKKKKSRINVRGPDLLKNGIPQSVNFTEVVEHLYGVDEVLWVDSVAIALARAGWPHNGGPLEKMEIGKALQALTGRVPVKVFSRDEKTNATSGTVVDMINALSSYAGRKTPVVLLTGQPTAKVKPNHAYTLSYLDKKWRLYNPSSVTFPDKAKLSIEDIFDDVLQVWGVKNAEEFL